MGIIQKGKVRKYHLDKEGTWIDLQYPTSRLPFAGPEIIESVIMAPRGTSRIKNKQLAKFNEVSTYKDGLCARKRKMGENRSPGKSRSQWNNEELKRFYEAFCKYGKDWEKVASTIGGRSVDMVKALYSMNGAYLSLPAGTASAAGLIAMMTDHYNILVGSRREGESKDGIGVSCKSQKHVRRKLQLNKSNGLDSPLPDLFKSLRSFGCLSLVKKKRSGGSRPRTFGKRTTCFPDFLVYDKDERSKSGSSNKEDLKLIADSADKEVTHVVALALTEASQREGSPQASQASNRRIDNMGANKCAESEKPSSKVVSCGTGESWYKCGPEDGAAKGETLVNDASYMVDAEGTGAVEIQQKQNDFQGKMSEVYGVKGIHLSDIKEASTVTEEGPVPRVISYKPEHEVTYDKGLKYFPLSYRRRSRWMSSRELSVQDTKEKRKLGSPCAPGTVPSNCQRKRSKIFRKKERKSADVGIIFLKKQGKDSSLHVDALSEGKQETYQPTTNMQKRKIMSSAAAGPLEVVKESADNAKCVRNTVLLPKEEKRLRLPETMKTDPGWLEKYSVHFTGQISTPNLAYLPTKSRYHHKENSKKEGIQKEMKYTQNVRNNGLEDHNRAQDLKSKLSHCLSSQALHRWCAFEWFYSAIDYPWFARSEFMEYLNHVGLVHIPRLTHVEWGVIRSSLSKPGRFSKQFLEDEGKKLEQYRESVRTHYGEVHADLQEGLATDLAHPLSTGQLVIAHHPRTREIYYGNVLNVDHKKYMIQFDMPRSSVELVEDIDCMPLNLLESLSEVPSKVHGAPSKVHGAPSKGDTLDTMLQAEAAAEDAVTAQAICKQPVTLAEIQEKEADIKAISELAWALDKKGALLSELKHMNEEVSGSRKNGNYAIDPEFKKQYAAVVVQLKAANDQVSSSLLNLVECNAFCVKSVPDYRRSFPNSQHIPVGNLELSTHITQDSRAQVSGIAESSRPNVKEMVDTAMQVISYLKQGDVPFLSIEKAIDSIFNNQPSGMTSECIIPDPTQDNYRAAVSSSRCGPAVK